MNNPQSDWVFDEDGRQLVDDIFPISELSGLEASVRASFTVREGATLQHLNKSTNNAGLNRVLAEHDEIIQ